MGPDSAGSAASTAPTGFVLAGGGFKGAFELGALRHLIADLGITPDVVASASAGSILGMVLSQGRSQPEFVEQLDHAQRTLLAMTSTELVFGHQEWLGEFKDTDFARRVISMVTDRSAPRRPGWRSRPRRAGQDDAGQDGSRRHGCGPRRRQRRSTQRTSATPTRVARAVDHARPAAGRGAGPTHPHRHDVVGADPRPVRAGDPRRGRRRHPPGPPGAHRTPRHRAAHGRHGGPST